MTALPLLPPLEGELLLDVFTHASLHYDGKAVNEDFGDNKRLSVIGSAALSMAITYRLFAKRPMLSAAEITAKHAELLSDANIEDWVQAYSLRKNLKFAPNALHDINTPLESKFLLYSYLGGVYCQRGIIPIQNWINSLVMYDPNEPRAPGQTFSLPPQPMQAPLGLPPSSPGGPSNSTPSGMSFLALFNQTCQQSKYTVVWGQAESAGFAHSLRWTITCSIDGVQKGRGVGASLKLAKEDAAKAAATSLGWNHIIPA